MSTKNEQEREALKRYLVNYLNLEKRYPLLPGTKNPEAVASFIGLSLDELTDSRATCDDQAEMAAQEILKDDEMLRAIERVPFKKGQTVLAIGDTFTDDLAGWFEILRHVLEIARPDLELEFINMGVHEDTSTDALRRVNRTVLDINPDWVFVALGSYDAMRLHAAPDRTIVSLADFWENLNSIENAIIQSTQHPVIWVTPAPVITELMERVPLFDGLVYEDDLVQFREVVAGRTGYIVDPPGRRMGSPADAWNFLPDGFYHAITGHTNTVKRVLVSLSSKRAVKHDKDSLLE